MKFFIKTKLSENLSKTPEGFLLCQNVPIAHTGKLKYARGEHPFPDIGELEVTREQSELHSPATIASFTGKSLTVEHPVDLLDADTWKESTHGTVLAVRASPEKIDVDGNLEDALLADILINSAEAIQEVENGKREVSVGIDCLWVQTGNNSAVQKNIIGNHIALVNTGRAGKQFSITDSGEKMKLEQVLAMFKKITGKSFDEAMKEDVAKDGGSADEIKAKIAALQEELKALESAPVKDESAGGAPAAEGGDKLDKILALLEKMCSGTAGDEKDEKAELVMDSAEEKAEKEKQAANDAAAIDDETGSRAEILAPGIALTKDVRAKALEVAYKATDGKKVIDSLLGGKTLEETLKGDHSVLFTAASEMLKSDRGFNFAKFSKNASAVDAFPTLQATGMTAEEINKKNEERYKTK